MMDKLRLRFSKTGRAIYISHLDLMHTMQRAFSRAGYALRYSEGFNPHPQISIALPLSVGAASLCEIMDFRLKEEPDLKVLPERLTAALPEGIRVIEAYEAVRKTAQLKWLAVEGVMEYDERDAQEMARALTAFYAADAVVITKKTKRGSAPASGRSPSRRGRRPCASGPWCPRRSLRSIPSFSRRRCGSSGRRSPRILRNLRGSRPMTTKCRFSAEKRLANRR